MIIKIDNKEADLQSLGSGYEKNGVYHRNVTFQVGSNTFTLDIVLGQNGTGIDYTDPADFYAKNKDEVDAALRTYFSQTDQEASKNN